MIPKKIHYCWFGRGKKPKLFYKCLKSWKKYFPDFQIIEWNEDNFDITCNKYVLQAYEQKKYAFVSDFARLKIMYENGGIYFDTDVEVLKKFDDIFLENGYFASEKIGEVQTGLGFACKKNNVFVKMMLDDYDNILFIKENGDLDLTPCPIRNTKSLVENGVIDGINSKFIGETELYNPEFFCGWDLDNHVRKITNNTYTIHHYNASWVGNKEKFKSRIKRLVVKIIGIKNYSRIKKLVHKERKKNEV